MPLKGYKYNFSNFMGQCELNYMLLCRLLPEIDDEDEFEYLVQDRYILNLTITERSRYTICVTVSIKNSSYQPDWLPETGIDIRLYHDAHLAEVVDNKGVAMQPVNPYPNPDMLQKDEKQGLNEFLGEWLSFCLKHGQSTETIATSRFSENEE